MFTAQEALEKPPGARAFTTAVCSSHVALEKQQNSTARGLREISKVPKVGTCYFFLVR